MTYFGRLAQLGERLVYTQKVISSSLVPPNKGGKKVEHEIFRPALEVVRASHQRLLGRDPKTDDKLFWIPANGDSAAPPHDV